MAQFEKIFCVIVKDDSGREDVSFATSDPVEARTNFDGYVGGDYYSRLEVSDVVGGNHIDGWELDNNNTIDTYFPDNDY